MMADQQSPWRQGPRRSERDEPTAPWQARRPNTARGQEPQPGVWPEWPGSPPPRQAPGGRNDENNDGARQREAIERLGQAISKRAAEGATPTPESIEDAKPTDTPVASEAQGRHIVPTAVRVQRLIADWWMVQVQIANGSIWWPITGAATNDEDQVRTTANAVRRGEQRILKTNDGELLLEGAPA